MTCRRTIMDVSNFGGFTISRLGNSQFCARTPNPLSDSFRFEVNMFGRHQQSKPIKGWRLSPRTISSVVLPLLPLNSKQVLVPSERKTLHLYEARCLALLEKTCLANSLTWAEKEPSLECSEAFIPPLNERISFAAFQLVSGKYFNQIVPVRSTGSNHMASKMHLDTNDTITQHI